MIPRRIVGGCVLERYLIVALFLTAVPSVCGAEDRPKLPKGAPPRFARVVAVKGDVIVYRDCWVVPPIPKKAGPVNPKELMPAYPAFATAAFAVEVEFSLNGGPVFDAEGRKLSAAAAKKALAAGDAVLVASGSQKVDPAYLQIVRKGTIVLPLVSGPIASGAADKPKLPKGAPSQFTVVLPNGTPPRFATVVAMKGDVIVYRDCWVVPAIPKKAGPPNSKELAPAPGSGYPSAAFLAVEFSLKDGLVLDAQGRKLDVNTAKKRLAVGDTVLVGWNTKVDPAYLRVVKKGTIILVHQSHPVRL